MERWWFYAYIAGGWGGKGKGGYTNITALKRGHEFKLVPFPPSFLFLRLHPPFPPHVSRPFLAFPCFLKSLCHAGCFLILWEILRFFKRVEGKILLFVQQYFPPKEAISCTF